VRKSGAFEVERPSGGQVRIRLKPDPKQGGGKKKG
jgi:hypothetical protein